MLYVTQTYTWGDVREPEPIEEEGCVCVCVFEPVVLMYLMSMCFEKLIE